MKPSLNEGAATCRPSRTGSTATPIRSRFEGVSTSVDCGQCGATNRVGARVLQRLWHGVGPRACSSCGAELSATARFCDQCGTPVAGASPVAPAAPPAAPSGTAVRKTVTVLFADLGGSTSFGERTDAELARTVMAEYHAVLQQVIDDHAGTVAKFMGDGMMATFGIPEVAEDDARRAVRAGLDAQRRFETFAAAVARGATARPSRCASGSTPARW